MRLLRLRLRNFKGIREFTLDAQGANCTVYGANEAGKTSLVDAYQWLLFGKDSSNRADFGIKTLDRDGKVIHGLDHEVEAVFDLNGRNLTLRRVFSEKWTKKRGSATATFTGHETSYYVDGVPVKEKEYQARVAGIADEAVFRLLTDPYHFNRNLSWQERRRILLEVCGDITDQEVIASDSSLSALPSILAGRSIDEHRKIIQARMSKINQELKEIPARIDEASRALPDSQEGKQNLLARLNEIRAALTAKREALAQATAGGVVAEVRVALREAEAELARLRSQQETQRVAVLRELKDKKADIERELRSLETDIVHLTSSIKGRREKLALLEEEIVALRQAWYKRNAEEFVYVPEPVCPTCGQPLPEEKLAEAREKALAEFNLQKARDLESITAQGKLYKAECDQLKTELTEMENELTRLEERKAEAKKQLERLEMACAEAEGTTDAGLEEAIAEAIRRRDELQAQLEALQEDAGLAMEGLRREISDLEEQARQIQADLLKVQAREQGLARIEELKRQEKALAAEYERLQGELYLCEQFVRAKVNLLEERINSKFRYARFKLFEQQVNGGITETCVTLYKGVPYPDLNGAAKVQIGLDIINTLAEHYNFHPPIFVDERESVTELFPVNSQVISLVVSPKDKTLRVEVEKDTLKEAV